MTEQEKINKIEEVFDMIQNSLNASMQLNDIVEYDSMARLSLIVMCEEEFGKTLTAEKVREFETVGDILQFLAD